MDSRTTLPTNEFLPVRYRTIPLSLQNIGVTPDSPPKMTLLSEVLSRKH